MDDLHDLGRRAIEATASTGTRLLRAQQLSHSLSSKEGHHAPSSALRKQKPPIQLQERHTLDRALLKPSHRDPIPNDHNQANLPFKYPTPPLKHLPTPLYLILPPPFPQFTPPISSPPSPLAGWSRPSPCRPRTSSCSARYRCSPGSSSSSRASCPGPRP